METPRLRNVLNLYLGGYLKNLRPNTFEKLRENILLDSINRKQLADKLERSYNKILALVPVNRSNEELMTATDINNQIRALYENNIKKYLHLENARDNEIQKLIKTFEVLEKSGIFNDK